MTKISRQNNILRMEDLLIVWIQDLIRKKIPLSGAAIREQALTFYRHVSTKFGSSAKESSCASKGWFDRFQKRFLLHNISFTGLY